MTVNIEKRVIKSLLIKKNQDFVKQNFVSQNDVSVVVADILK